MAESSTRLWEFSLSAQPIRARRVAALTTTTIGAAMVASILVLPELLQLWGRPIGEAE